MKDVQGIQRGRCNAACCECEEYRTSSQSSLVRCEYCNHTPVDHVRIIVLGACSSCGKDDCNEYQSEDPNSYTDCEYCGCPAQMHSGADKLRKPRSQTQQPEMSMMSGQTMPQTVSGENTGFQPRYDAHDQPVQQATYGLCKCSGCRFPKRKEGDKIHDFCSRTCAKKYSDAQASFYRQKVAASKTAQQSSSPRSSARSQQPPGARGPVTSSVPPPSTTTSLSNVHQGQQPSNTLSQSSGALPPSATGGKMCSKCQVRRANVGKGWCQQCFTLQS